MIAHTRLMGDTLRSREQSASEWCGIQFTSSLYGKLLIRPGGLKLVLGRDKRTAIDAKPRFDSLAYFISPSLLLADILIESSSLQVPAVSFFIALPSLVLDPPEYRYQNTPLQVASMYWKYGLFACFCFSASILSRSDICGRGSRHITHKVTFSSLHFSLHAWHIIFAQHSIGIFWLLLISFCHRFETNRAILQINSKINLFFSCFNNLFNSTLF